MTRITARLPETLLLELDAAAARLRISRSGFVREELESCLEEREDVSLAVDRLRDPHDPVFDQDDIQ